jgi:lipopolysaccharide export system permease protein
MVRTLDRYILRLVLPPFMLALLVFTFMLQMQPLQNVAEPFIARGVPFVVILRIFIALLPQALAITIPMAFLLGLLIAFGRLSADSEWVALQACGVSLPRLLRPVGVLAVLTWATTSWMIIVALPWGNRTFVEIRYNILASWAEAEVKPRVFFEDYPNSSSTSGMPIRAWRAGRTSSWPRRTRAPSRRSTWRGMGAWSWTGPSGR